MSKYTVEEVLECADGYEALGEPVGASMLRAYAAELRARDAGVPDVRAMVNRFLGWRLPSDFHPDGGISFVHITDPAWTHDSWPIGTNLLNAGQAEQMFLYVLTTAEPVAQGEVVALRRLLAERVAGLNLYVDDGELSDSSTYPHIDFIRDTPEAIAEKLKMRGMIGAQPHAMPDELKELADEVEACWICASIGDGEITLDTINNWSGRLSALAAQPGDRA